MLITKYKMIKMKNKTSKGSEFFPVNALFFSSVKMERREIGLNSNLMRNRFSIE